MLERAFHGKLPLLSAEGDATEPMSSATGRNKQTDNETSKDMRRGKIPALCVLFHPYVYQIAPFFHTFQHRRYQFYTNNDSLDSPSRTPLFLDTCRRILSEYVKHVGRQSVWPTTRGNRRLGCSGRTNRESRPNGFLREPVFLMAASWD